MNILTRLFWLPFNRRVVDTCFTKSMESFLKARGLWRISLSDELINDLLAEAHERARAQEPDRKARYGVLWKEMEEIAETASHIYKNHQHSDPAIDAILSKHGVEHRRSNP
jgi:hypothetical protein